MQFVSRSKWGARASRGTSYLASTKGVKVHYVGSPVSSMLLTQHSLCDDMVRQIQKSHMDGNGWNDIGYSALVCPHGYVFEGRGLHRLPAANGEGLNSGHYAVCGLVGDSGLRVPTDQMYNGIRDAIEWLRSKGDAGNEIKRHKDGYATSCPGPYLSDWVLRGAPRKDEEMATAKEVWDYPITSNNPKPWKAGSLLANLETDVDRTNETVSRLELKVTAMAETLDSLVAKIESLQ